MRSSKVFLLLGLMAAIVLLVSSEMATRDLSETSSERGGDDVKPDRFGSIGRAIGGAIGRGSSPRGGFPRGGRGGGHGGHGGGQGCDHGCCRGSLGSRCERCCVSAAEAAEKAAQVKPHN